MSLPITPSRFFDAWCRACCHNHDVLCEHWKSPSDYTKAIFENGSVIQSIKTEFGLGVYGNYYHTDAVFIDEARDRVPGAPSHQNWFHNIRIAFEHENAGDWYQEISHLLILRAELRVLVVYPNGTDHFHRELDRLAKTIYLSEIGENPAFLLISGWREGNSQIEWQGHSFQGATVSRLNSLAQDAFFG